MLAEVEHSDQRVGHHTSGSSFNLKSPFFNSPLLSEVVWVNRLTASNIYCYACIFTRVSLGFIDVCICTCLDFQNLVCCLLYM